MSRWQRFLCNFMGWHRVLAGQSMTTDGCSALSRCYRCGQKVAMDSQGNWFRMDWHEQDKRACDE